MPANVRQNFSAKRVPKHFTSPEVWSKAIPVLLDAEIAHLAAAAILPLDERGRSFLLDEEKMIAQRIFSRLPARLHRCKFRMLTFDITVLIIPLVIPGYFLQCVTSIQFAICKPG